MSRRHCLVIDDDRIAATFLVELVAAQGLAVDLARNLREAEERIAQTRYDILLVDRRLGDGDGVHWLSQVLASAGHDPKPRCLLTSGDLIDVDDLPAGVGQLRKPVDAERLCCWLVQDSVAAEGMPDNRQSDAPIRGEATALLDDTGALARFGGNRDALRSLRAMLLAELLDSARWRQALRQPTPPASAIDALHRLRAACALTGCARLGQLSEGIESGLRRGSSTPAGALVELDSVVAATIAAISAQAV